MTTPTGTFGMSSVDGYDVHIACPDPDCYWSGSADAGTTLDELHQIAAGHLATAHPERVPVVDPVTACPRCGGPVDVEWIDVSTGAHLDRQVPGRVSCRRHCDATIAADTFDHGAAFVRHLEAQRAPRPWPEWLTADTLPRYLAAAELNPYSDPPGTVTVERGPDESAVWAMPGEDVDAFIREWMRPANGTTDWDELVAILRRHPIVDE